MSDDRSWAQRVFGLVFKSGKKIHPPPTPDHESAGRGLSDYDFEFIGFSLDGRRRDSLKAAQLEAEAAREKQSKEKK